MLFKFHGAVHKDTEHIEVNLRSLSGKQSKPNSEKTKDQNEMQDGSSYFPSCLTQMVIPRQALSSLPFFPKWERNWPSQEESCPYFSHLSSPLYLSFDVQDGKSDSVWESSIQNNNRSISSCKKKEKDITCITVECKECKITFIVQIHKLERGIKPNKQTTTVR